LYFLKYCSICRSLFRVQTNDVRLSSKDKDYHFFASDFTTDRVNLEGLSKVSPNKENIHLTVNDFVPNEEEYKQFSESLKLLLARELLKFEGFKWMESIVPLHIPHIPHDFEEDMAKNLRYTFYQSLSTMKLHTKTVST